MDQQEYETDASLALEDPSERQVEKLHPLVSTITDRYGYAKRARQATEDRWLKAYLNYRGQYAKDIKFLESERSRVFVKITKTKVLASYGQVIDVLFSTSRLPLEIEPTRLPENIEEKVHVDLQDLQSKPGDEEDPEVIQDPIGYAGDGKDLPPGATLSDRLGVWLANKLQGKKIKEGFGKTKTSIDFEPAKMAAKKMEQKIHDQLEESDADKHLRRAMFEMVLLGTGIIKGPFHTSREYPKWDETGGYSPIIKQVPNISYVSCWDFYPDPEGTNMQDVDWVIQRHKMSRTALRQLRLRPYFITDQISKAIEYGPESDDEWWEHEIVEANYQHENNRYEVLEYWGNIDRDRLNELSITIPSELSEVDEFQINAWVCNNCILRVVVNPFKPRRIPYQACPYELDPYNFFGVGLAENMEDSQTLMNGFARLAVDNAVMSGSVMLEVDETNLIPGQDFKVYPGKVWRRAGGPPGQAVFATKWPNTTNENMMVFDKFRQLADEQTGLPSYSHGATGISGTGRTASGMSMLMGAANLNTKTVIKNVDDYLIRPLGEALFAFNMQFDHDPSIVGDLAIRARGTAALMQREVKSQRIMQFVQATANPLLAPMVKYSNLLRELAASLELDPDKTVNNPAEAKLQAETLGKMGSMVAPATENGSEGGPDMSGKGDGTIGTGAPPMPGTSGFSGTPQGSGNGTGTGPTGPTEPK